jgi:hypothetical protein
MIFEGSRILEGTLAVLALDNFRSEEVLQADAVVKLLL